MYRILNPMNHNVSLVRNGNGEELVVIGKGIAFGKKKGDLISEEQVEKVFRMKTEESRENFYDFTQGCSARLYYRYL